MKRIILLVVMLCSLALAAGPAFALSLSLVPSNQWIQRRGHRFGGSGGERLRPKLWVSAALM